MTAIPLLSLNLGSQTDVALTRSLVREVAARLQAAARIIRELVRSPDVLAGWDSEEFLIVLLETDAGGALHRRRQGQSEGP